MTDDPTVLRTLHESLRAGRFEGNVYGLLHRFGNAGFVEAQPTVELFLSSADPQLRYIALNVLVLHWNMPTYQHECLRMLDSDPDEDVRRLAARCVGTLFSDTRSADALSALLKVIVNDGIDADIRAAAYTSLLEVLGAPPSEWRTKPSLQWPNDVRRERVREAQAIVVDSYRS